MNNEINSIYSIGAAAIERAKDEAKHAEANIIKIKDEKKGKRPFARFRISIQMYYLKEPYLTVYRKKIDSLTSANAGFCIIHLKNYNHWHNYQIYLNDSIRTFIARGRGENSLDFKFNKSVNLSLSKNSIGITLDKGKEYYFNIMPYTGKYQKGSSGVYLQLCTKYDF